MNTATLTKSVVTIPAIRRLMLPVKNGGLAITRDELEADIKQRIPDAVKEVTMVYPWDFAIKETTFTTVIDQASYTLTGANDDALSIYYMKDMTTGNEIISKSINSMNEIVDDVTNLIPSKYWIPDGRDGTFPKIKILATPISADSITYQYWRNNVSIGEMSADFDPLLVEALGKRFADSRMKFYEQQLVKVINNYDRPNAKIEIAELDPWIKAGNWRLNSLNGWGGH